MVTNKWGKLQWILNFLLELKKNSHPIAKIGKGLVLASVGTPLLTLFLTAQINLQPNNIISEVILDFGGVSFLQAIFSGITFTLGIILIVFDIWKSQKKARHTAKVLITGMLGTSPRFPDNLLSYSEKTNARETVLLGLPEIQDNSINENISLYNAELRVRLYERFILHHDCDKYFMGGLTRVPFLVAYGACFRATSANVIYFDKFHRGGEWRLLNDVNDNISLAKYNIENVFSNSNGDIGLAVSFSFPIKEEQLPDAIKENTLFISPNIGNSRNLIKNQDNLQRISENIQTIIDELSNKENCKKIHLFLSVQSTLALDIGRKYQEGTHKNWIIHNFDASKGKYNWAIELSKDGLSRLY